MKDIILLVHSAHGLADEDIGGTSDPYVIIKYKEQEYKSLPIQNSLNPKFNFTARLYKQGIGENLIKITVMDEDIGRDDSLGDFIVDMNDPKNSEGFSFQDFKLTKSGSVKLSLKYSERNEGYLCSSGSKNQSVQRTVIPPGKDEVNL